MEKIEQIQDIYPTPPRSFSAFSTAGVADSLWFCSDFLVGAGTVIIQQVTGKVVLVYCNKDKIWFLPKGRKDVGESLEQTALREAYEESGYRAHFLPLNAPTRAPSPPDLGNASTERPLQTAGQPRLNTEPIYISTRSFERTSPRDGGEYITFWYAAFIGPDAIRKKNTGMPEEQHFESHLMSPEEAVGKLEETAGSIEAYFMAQVVRRAHAMWLETHRVKHT